MAERSVVDAGSKHWTAGRATVPIAAGLSRRDLFTGLLVLGCVNGLTSRIIGEVNLVGWAGALFDTFGISVIVWISCFAGLTLVLRDRSGQASAVDFAVGTAFLLAVALPISALSWVAIAAFCVYILATTNDESTKQGAIILIATTVPMLWSRLLFNFFANPILNADTVLVSWLLGTTRTGNTIDFADHSGHLVIFGPCSSLANVSIAMLCWVTVSELALHRRSSYDVFWCFLACVSVIAVNVSRMAMMGQSETLYNTVHSNVGNAVTSLLITMITVTICITGVRRELFAHI